MAFCQTASESPSHQATPSCATVPVGCWWNPTGPVPPPSPLGHQLGFIAGFLNVFDGLMKQVPGWNMLETYSIIYTYDCVHLACDLSWKHRMYVINLIVDDGVHWEL